MEKLLRFFRALEYARERGYALSCDYSYDNFASADWDWWTIYPGKTDFCVSPEGILIDGNYYPWSICSRITVHHIISGKHLGRAISSF